MASDGEPLYPSVSAAAGPRVGADGVEEHGVVVVGAGLAGAMSALMFAQRGFQVTLYEKRDDLREEFKRDAKEEEAGGGSFWGTTMSSTKRSINLALSHRGLEALRKVGVEERVMPHAIKMFERAMHDKDSSALTFQPYGKDASQHINSISRALINTVLLDECEKLKNVNLVFKTKLVSMDSEAVLTMAGPSNDKFRVRANLVIGADGAYSGVRTSMLRLTRADFSRHYIEHGYKELTIPPTDKGEFALSPVNALHIWPRGTFMMIALPNPDKTFTATVFAPFSTLDAITTPAAVKEFFEREFPDVVHIIPELAEQFLAVAAGPLVTVKMNPWTFNDKAVLIGDAAHAMVPFYGQGMNCGFEDALFLDEMLEAHGGKFAPAIAEYSKLRQPAGDAIADLSYGNYIEMRDHTASQAFLLRKRVEGWLHWMFPEWWIPQYTMVAFTRIPYDEVVRRSKRQDHILATAGWVTGAALLGAAVWGGATLLSKRSRL